MIKTERLTIAPFEMKYLRDYFDGFDGEITKYQWPDPFASVDGARDLLRAFLDEMARGESLVFSILSHDGRFLGSVEVHALPEARPELGVWVIKSEQNKGYAYEALRAVLDYTRAEYDKRAFFYEADIRNEASVKLLHKLEDGYEILEQGLEECTTDSGKALRLRGYVLKAKET